MYNSSTKYTISLPIHTIYPARRKSLAFNLKILHLTEFFLYTNSVCDKYELCWLHVLMKHTDTIKAEKDLSMEMSPSQQQKKGHQAGFFQHVQTATTHWLQNWTDWLNLNNMRWIGWIWEHGLMWSLEELQEWLFLRTILPSRQASVKVKR